MSKTLSYISSVALPIKLISSIIPALFTKISNFPYTFQVSIDEICRECNITRGGFYHHFSSKEEILHGISMSLDYNIKEYYDCTLKELGSLEQIQKIVQYYLEFSSDIGLDVSRQLSKIMIEGKDTQLLSMERYSAQILLQCIRKGKEAKEIREDLSEQYISLAFHNFTIGQISDWCYNHGRYDLVTQGSKVIKEFINMIKT